MPSMPKYEIFRIPKQNVAVTIGMFSDSCYSRKISFKVSYYALQFCIIMTIKLIL